LQKEELADLEAQAPWGSVQVLEKVEHKQVPQVELETLAYNMPEPQVAQSLASFDYNGLPLNSYTLRGWQP
jgi:hypothetical protein